MDDADKIQNELNKRQEDAEKRASSAYNETVKNYMSGKSPKDSKTDDYINIETYDPNFKNRKSDVKSASKALITADQELQREKNRSPREATFKERLSGALGLKKGGSVGSASKRADGIAQRGKTKGRMC
jgi:hypothetical protein